MTIVEALNTLYDQIVTDIGIALPTIDVVYFGEPREDAVAPYAVVRLRIENMQQHALGKSTEFDAVFSITVVKPLTAGTIPMVQKITDSKELTARLTAVNKYASIASSTNIDGIVYDDLGDAQVKEQEFTVDVRFFVAGTIDG